MLGAAHSLTDLVPAPCVQALIKSPESRIIDTCRRPLYAAACEPPAGGKGVSRRWEMCVLQEGNVLPAGGIVASRKRERYVPSRGDCSAGLPGNELMQIAGHFMSK